MDEEEPQGSGCAGAAVITAVVLGLACGLYAAAPEAFVLGLWAVGWGAIIWAARRPVPNPSPEGEVEGGSDEKPQVGGPSTTQVGEACTIVSLPNERRSYGVEKRGATDT
jgi:hypothetical protein